MSQSAMLAPLPDVTLEEVKPSISFKFGARTWGYIIAASLITGLLATIFTFLAKPSYVSSRTVLVTSGSNPTDNETLVASFSELMTSRGFAAELKDRSKVNLPVESIMGMISVDRPPLAALMIINVTGPDLKMADTISQQVVPTLRDIISANEARIERIDDNLQKLEAKAAQIAALEFKTGVFAAAEDFPAHLPGAGQWQPDACGNPGGRAVAGQ